MYPEESPFPAGNLICCVVFAVLCIGTVCEGNLDPTLTGWLAFIGFLLLRIYTKEKNE